MPQRVSPSRARFPRPALLAWALLLAAPAQAPARAPDPEALAPAAGTFEQRRDRVLAAQVAEPFPRPVCGADGPPGNRCIWGKITLALSLLHGPEQPASAERASALLREVAEALPERTGWKRSPVPRPPHGAPEVDPGLDFPFLTATLLRRALGPADAARTASTGRLAPDAERAIRDVFRAWAGTECRIADADPAMVWRPWGSENHDVQRVQACWAGAELMAGEPGAGEPVYADGSTPEAQRAAWTAYWKAFIRARAKGGLVVEFFSPTYSKYTLGVLHNLIDFSGDAELRRLAENAVALWWALWAQEQLGGVHGGSKARFHPDRMQAGMPVDGLVWLYFGTGRQTGAAVHPANFPMLTSRFRMPAAVEALALEQGGRGAREVWTRHLGLAAGPMSGGRYSLSPDLTAVVRYTFSAPGYVMGTSVVPRLPGDRWTAISSQNRWNGVVLADGPDARVYATPAPQGARSTYNAVLAAQSRGAQMVQRLPPPFSARAGDMAIHVGPGLRRVERDGWVFVEGSAFVAARPAFGGYAADPDPERPSFRLLDQRSPVVVQAGARADHAGFEAFQAAVLAAPLRVDAEEVRFRGLDGAGELRFFLDSGRRPEVDGKPIDAPAGWALHSPSVRQAMGSDAVEITAGGRVLRLAFD